MRKRINVILALALLMLGAGCSTDMKNIEKLNYANAIGVDFKDGNYHCYIQSIDFQSVAKTSDGQKGPGKIWIGEGIGSNLEDALFQTYESAQERIIWGHVTAIVISENAIKEGIIGIYDSFSRYYEFRLTPWIFATRESVKDIFSATGFFERSPLNSILHEPKSIHSQSSYVTPIRLHTLIRQTNEPGFTSCIPSLAINKKMWTEKKKQEPKLRIDGAVFLKNESFKSYIPLEKLSGLRWVRPGTIRAGISVPDPKHPSVQIAIENPKRRLQYSGNGDGPRFDLRVKGTGYTVSRIKNDLVSLSLLTSMTESAIEKEIRDLYKLGIEKKTDVLNMEYDLFRYQHKKWKELTGGENVLLTDEALQDVTVDINIEHTSTEKNERVRGAARH
ncbi:Ger(x)C family spore germination protein [Paenibacillus ginsengarvi]|nr:Ger(x)C family spore germination protein [Paenibacillus ginsengarvi]